MYYVQDKDVGGKGALCNLLYSLEALAGQARSTSSSQYEREEEDHPARVFDYPRRQRKLMTLRKPSPLGQILRTTRHKRKAQTG